MGRVVTSHVLAEALLEAPDLPLAFMDGREIKYAAGAHSTSHGGVLAAIVRHYTGDHVALGTMWEGAYARTVVERMLVGEMPKPWPVWVPGRGRYEWPA